MTYQPSFLPPKPTPRLEEKSPRFVPKPKSLLYVVYIEMGNSGSSDTATLAFTFSGTSTIRTFEIKATQIPCSANYKPPEGCLQYHTTLAGRFQSFNFADSTSPMHLASQKYDKYLKIVL